MHSAYKWEIAVLAGSYYHELTRTFFGNVIGFDYDDEQGMQFFAHSLHVDILNDPDLAAQRIYSLQLLLNGALRLSSGDVHFKPLHFFEFRRLDGGLRHPVRAQTIEENPFCCDPEMDGDLNDPNFAINGYLPRLVNLLKTDSDLRALLLLVGLVSSNTPIECILTWGTLYKILDTIRHHSNVMVLPIDSFADRQQVDKFAAACNNMSILGVYARHGALGNSPPKNVITNLDEAIDLIVSMASKFCNAYVNTKYGLETETLT